MRTRRLHVLVDDDRYRRLQEAARRRQVSVATVVRDAIDRHIGAPAMERQRAGRRYLEAPPMNVGDVDDLATELENLRRRHE